MAGRGPIARGNVSVVTAVGHGGNDDRPPDALFPRWRREPRGKNVKRRAAGETSRIFYARLAQYLLLCFVFVKFARHAPTVWPVTLETRIIVIK